MVILYERTKERIELIPIMDIVTIARREKWIFILLNTRVPHHTKLCEPIIYTFVSERMNYQNDHESVDIIYKISFKKTSIC